MEAIVLQSPFELLQKFNITSQILGFAKRKYTFRHNRARLQILSCIKSQIKAIDLFIYHFISTMSSMLVYKAGFHLLYL